jgi:cysteinyl-tRNA synthetase
MPSIPPETQDRWAWAAGGRHVRRWPAPTRSAEARIGIVDEVTEPIAAAGGATGNLTLTLDGTLLPLPGRARIYACGITPYDVTHLGHAATFVWVDTLARILRSASTEVILCRNVTDVDDVLLAAANRAGSPYDRYAAIQQFYFDRDMAALGVTEPALQPRAHTFIGQVIALGTGLLARGAAYRQGGSVYFSGAAAASQSGLDRETALRLSAEYGDRPDDAAKKDPFDVVIWQAVGPDEGQAEVVAWPSPWGPGRPGWHAECAAMAMHAFGPAVDVHAGGADLRFPHHAYQAAMAEQFSQVTPFGRTRFNVGVVTVGGAKMAKSTGNLVLVSDLVAHYSAAAVRLLILDRAWPETWDYVPAELDAAARGLEVLQAAAGRPDSSSAAVDAVRAALADNLDVPSAIAIAQEAGGQAARVLGTLLGLW